MSFYDEPFDPTSARGMELMAIATVGFVDKAPPKQFVASVGIDQIAINCSSRYRLLPIRMHTGRRE
jgi:hypothetical protein